MKSLKFGRLAGLMLAAAIAGAPMAAPAFAQEAAPAAAEAAPAAPATTAPAPAPEVAAPAAAAEEAPPTPDKGDTTWMMISMVLVLLMIVPGLALFYGGLVRSKNMLSMLVQVTTVACIGIITWVFWGYSLSFTDGGGLNTFIGGLSKVGLKGAIFNDAGAFTNVETFSKGVVIPELIFVAFQATFAAITAALVLGGVAERMKFMAVVVFAVLWPLLSYYPMAHMVWWWAGATSAFGMDPAELTKGAGLLWGWGALDFAGGTVVHINAGIAALIGCLVLGKRTGYQKEPMQPHSLTLTMVGAGLLWVGWFGFNAGSNLEANGYAGLALINTLVATAAAGVSWLIVEQVTRGKASGLGLASGIVAGLVAITPAAGFAGPVGAIILGLLVSPICVFFCSVVKNALKYDDSLDAFGIHAVGGIVGAIATGILVNPAFGGAGLVDFTKAAAAEYNMGVQVMAQVKAVGVAVVWSAIASTIVFVLIKFTFGLRVNAETEEDGLDIAEHGERAYH